MTGTLSFRFDSDFEVADWLALYHASGYNGWWTRRHAEAMRDHAYLIATAWQGGTMVATVTVRSDRVNFAWIDDVVVRPELRGQGIGSTLMRYVLDRLRPLHLDFIQLSPLPGRESFYERLGFVRHENVTLMDYKPANQVGA